MSVHWKGLCIKTDNIDCRVPCETKWNKRQPYLTMQGFASSVRQEDKDGKIITIIE